MHPNLDEPRELSANKEARKLINMKQTTSSPKQLRKEKPKGRKPLAEDTARPWTIEDLRNRKGLTSILQNMIC
jgi:hypothetical protein